MQVSPVRGLDDPRHYYALTAAHCFADGDEVKVTIGPLVKFVAKRIATAKNADLALIKITTKSTLVVVKVATKAVTIGVTVWHKGYGRDDPGNVEFGAALSTGESETYLRHAAHLSPGDSGSALFHNGEVVGVNVRVNTYTGVGAAVPLEKVRDFLAQFDL